MSFPKPTLHQLLQGAHGRETASEGSRARIVAVADLPTRFGNFEVVAFHSPLDHKEHAALVKGDVVDRSKVPVRLHSECLTGDTFGSLRCDCRDQLELAIQEIEGRGVGVILYLRQEGRGIGLENKIKAYQLQEHGFDTIEANEALGFKADERDYQVAAEMLAALRVKSILLMSNNPAKIVNLKAHGVQVDGRIPIQVEPNPYNFRYMETKRRRAGHLLKPPTPRLIQEQIDCLRVKPTAGRRKAASSSG